MKYHQSARSDRLGLSFTCWLFSGGYPSISVNQCAQNTYVWDVERWKGLVRVYMALSENKIGKVYGGMMIKQQINSALRALVEMTWLRETKCRYRKAMNTHQLCIFYYIQLYYRERRHVLKQKNNYNDFCVYMYIWVWICMCFLACHLFWNISVQTL